MTPRSPGERSDGGRLREQLRERTPAALDTSEDGGREPATNGAADDSEATGVKEEGAPGAARDAEGSGAAGAAGAAGTAEAAGADEAADDGADGAEPGADDAEPAPHGAGKEDSLAEATRERDEYLALAKRTQADFENYRKRAAREIAAAGARARIGLIRELLPVVDNLERALASATDADTGLAEGVRMVLSELQGVLSRAGVAVIEPDGDEFDPNVHEALSTRAQEGTDSGVVLDVVEKGYKTDDMVIRPARVVVAA